LLTGPTMPLTIRAHIQIRPAEWVPVPAEILKWSA
jgi:hypothetical protein